MEQRLKDFMAGFLTSNRNFNGENYTSSKPSDAHIHRFNTYLLESLREEYIPKLTDPEELTYLIETKLHDVDFMIRLGKIMAEDEGILKRLAEND